MVGAPNANITVKTRDQISPATNKPGSHFSILGPGAWQSAQLAGWNCSSWASRMPRGWQTTIASNRAFSCSGIFQLPKVLLMQNVTFKEGRPLLNGSNNMQTYYSRDLKSVNVGQMSSSDTQRSTQSLVSYLFALIYKSLESAKWVLYQSIHFFLYTQVKIKCFDFLHPLTGVVFTFSRTRSGRNSRLLSRSFSVEAMSRLPDRCHRKCMRLDWQDYPIPWSYSEPTTWYTKIKAPNSLHRFAHCFTLLQTSHQHVFFGRSWCLVCKCIYTNALAQREYTLQRHFVASL